MAKGARRVVTGLDDRGTAVFTSDGVPGLVIDRPEGLVITEMWRAGRLPADLDADGTPSEYSNEPSSEGLVFRIAEIPPERGVIDSEEHGMHESATVDFIVIISGEMSYKLGPGPENERLLKPGDSLIQRGTRHAWRNRSGKPCVMAVVKIGAGRGTD